MPLRGNGIVERVVPEAAVRSGRVRGNVAVRAAEAAQRQLIAIHDGIAAVARSVLLHVGRGNIPGQRIRDVAVQSGRNPVAVVGARALRGVRSRTAGCRRERTAGWRSAVPPIPVVAAEDTVGFWPRRMARIPDWSQARSTARIGNRGAAQSRAKSEPVALRRTATSGKSGISVSAYIAFDVEAGRLSDIEVVVRVDLPAIFLFGQCVVHRVLPIADRRAGGSHAGKAAKRVRTAGRAVTPATERAAWRRSGMNECGLPEADQPPCGFSR